MYKRMLLTLAAALMVPAALSTIAFASGTLPEGSYTLTIPGVTDNFTFEVTETLAGGAAVEAGVSPPGYEIEDVYVAKVAWKGTGESDDEVEVKEGKVEADVDWSMGDTIVLSVEDGLTISVLRKSNGVYQLTVVGPWTVLGDSGEWLVTKDDDPELAFKVEVDEDGVEIIAVNPEDEKFNDEDDEDEDESDDDDDGDGESEDDDDDGEPKGPKTKKGRP